MSGAALALQVAMRERLLAHAPLLTLLGGHHVFDESPRGAHEPFVVFSTIETRDWSVQDQKGHEHFVGLDVKTRSRGRSQAESIAAELEAALDDADLTLEGHALVNLRLVFWTVSKSPENYSASLRFRATTEPL